MHLLLVEDDSVIGMGLEYSLSQEGYQVALCPTAAQAREELRRELPGVCLLDLSLPDGNGYDLCRAVKELGDIPVIFLTACDEEVNVVMGLDMGADDYITKPFRLQEVLSRLRSVLRRYSRTACADNAIFTVGDLQVDPRRMRVVRAGREIPLTALEYRLLLSFLQNPGQTLSRTQLLESIWDVAGDFVNDNTLTVYIKRLREKLEDDVQSPRLIQTVRSVGYRLGDGYAAQ